jgi:hypothetical protein
MQNKKNAAAPLSVADTPAEVDPLTVLSTEVALTAKKLKETSLPLPPTMVALVDYWRRCLQLLLVRLDESLMWANEVQLLLHKAFGGLPGTTTRSWVGAKVFMKLLSVAQERGIRVKQR